MMILEYSAASALAEVRVGATPASLGHVVLSRGLEEAASFASQAVRQAQRTVDAYRLVLACELVAAVRASRLHGVAAMRPGLRRPRRGPPGRHRGPPPDRGRDSGRHFAPHPGRPVAAHPASRAPRGRARPGHLCVSWLLADAGCSLREGWGVARRASGSWWAGTVCSARCRIRCSVCVGARAAVFTTGSVTASRGCWRIRAVRSARRWGP